MGKTPLSLPSCRVAVDSQHRDREVKGLQNRKPGESLGAGMVAGGAKHAHFISNTLLHVPLATASFPVSGSNNQLPITPTEGLRSRGEAVMGQTRTPRTYCSQVGATSGPEAPP